MNHGSLAAAPQVPEDEGAIRPLLRAIRAHRLLVVAATLAALTGAVIYLTVREPTYEASATVVVNPLPRDDQVFLGLPLVRDSGDATRTVQTAASFLDSPQAARVAADTLGPDWSQQRVLSNISVDPQGETNIIAVTGTAEGANVAARLANEYTEATLAVRSEELEPQVADAIARTQSEIEAIRQEGLRAAGLASQLTQLRSIQQTGDPTLVLEQPAVAPRSPTSPGAMIVIPLALIAGFALGSGGALLRELSSRRLADVQAAGAVYPLPVLARVPILPARRLRGPRGATWYVPPEVREQFRTLAVQVAQREPTPGTILVTSPTRGDGKTTTAINLALSLAATGKRVALLDLDLRNPQVGAALKIGRPRPLSELIFSDAALEEMLVRPIPTWTLDVLAVEVSADEPDLSELLGQRLPELIGEARALADYVVIDTAPLGEVSDALRIAAEADDILVVIRNDNTLRVHLEVMRELLERSGRTPQGYIAFSARSRPTGGYYGYGGGRVEDLVIDGGEKKAPPTREDLPFVRRRAEPER